MNALRKIESARAYMEASNLKPMWKKELEKVENDLVAVERELSTTIDNLHYVNDKKGKLTQLKQTILNKAMEQDLFQC